MGLHLNPDSENSLLKDEHTRQTLKLAVPGFQLPARRQLRGIMGGAVNSTEQHRRPLSPGPWLTTFTALAAVASLCLLVPGDLSERDRQRLVRSVYSRPPRRPVAWSLSGNTSQGQWGWLLLMNDINKQVPAHMAGTS